MNTIIHADCIKGMTDLQSASVDFVLTDPPYLVDYRARDGRTVTNDDNRAWLRPAFRQIYRVLKPASFCVSFYAWNKVHLFRRPGAKPDCAPSVISSFGNVTPHPLAFCAMSTKPLISWPKAT